MTDIHVIDGLLDENLADQLEGFFLGDSVNWNYNPFTTRIGRLFSGSLYFPHIIETHQFTHQIVKDDMAMSSNPEIVPLSKILVSNIQEHVGMKFHSIHRLKANLLMQGDYRSEQLHPPHYDTIAQNHWSMVYYVNRSDGATHIFDKSADKDFESAQDVNEIYREMKCIQTVEPKKNRAVIFPSNRIHASSCPIQFKRRVVLNFVLKSQG